MLNPRRWLLATCLGLAALAAPPASAAGIGAGAAGAVLGQPLDFAVQVRLEPGDTLAPECVTAEVTTGDRRLPAGQVRTVVDAQGADLARIRVLTSQALDEPVIGISLSVGCTSRMTRQFVVLADPPISAPVVASAMVPALVAATAPALAAAPLEPGAGLPPGAALPQASPATAAGRATAAGVADPAAAARGGPLAAARAETGAASAKRPRAKAVARAAERGTRRTPAQRAEAATKRRAAATAVAAAPAPRLKLDLLESSPAAGSAATATAAVEDTVVDQALQAVAQAASAARAAASAASAAAERIAVLERTVEQVRGEAKSSSDMVAQLRTRLAQSDSASLWFWPLLALVALLAALALWLAWRMARLQSAQQQVWRQAAAQAPAVGDLTPSKLPTAPIPFVTSEIHLPPNTLPARPRPGPAWPPPAPADDWTAPAAPAQPRTDPRPEPRTEPRAMARTEPRRPSAINTVALSKLVPQADESRTPGERLEPAMQRTEVLPPQARADDSASRDVSIEELIDLEQQAEFFVVLGQDEAAVDLLVDHLRNTGGGSPLPYLKLLEIHHRRGDKAAYERMRTRFNHRFNAYAPEWDLGLLGGRSLEDYPGIVPRLQLVWSRPLDAMAELEALLFRKSRGELFDLPAYREVLFLYSLARDLLDREAADTGNVDLLLPLSDGGEFSPTTPNPYLGLERGRHPDDTLDFDTRPTSPVDFDLTAAERPSSIFDQLDDRPHTRRS